MMLYSVSYCYYGVRGYVRMAFLFECWIVSWVKKLVFDECMIGKSHRLSVSSISPYGSKFMHHLPNLEPTNALNRQNRLEKIHKKSFLFNTQTHDEG